jgi:hypothetical protein
MIVFVASGGRFHTSFTFLLSNVVPAVGEERVGVEGGVEVLMPVHRLVSNWHFVGLEDG